MKNLKTSLAWMGIALMLAVVPKATLGQSQTPVLESINLPFNIDGYVERQSSSYGDWTKGSQTNGNNVGSVFFNNGNVRNLPLTFHNVDSFNSSSDEAFAGGDKYNDNPNTWSTVTASVQGKSDINNVSLHFSNDTATGDLWTVMAADRRSTTGTSYLDFCFYQETLTLASGSFTSPGTACGRSVGDLLVTVKYTGGGSVDSIYFYRWATSTGSACGYDWEGFTIASNNAFGYSNTTSVNVPYSGYGSTSYITKQFVEIALNITNLVDGSINTNACTGLFFKSVLVKTKASTSASAVLKDVVAPIQLKLNLGKADIVYSTPVCAGGGVYTATNNGPSSTDGGTFTIDPGTGISIGSYSGTINVGSSASGTDNVY